MYKIRISVLQGGMHGWINYFAGMSSATVSPHSKIFNPYIDGFDPECWGSGDGPAQGGGLVHVMDALWSSGGQKALSDALTAELETLLQKQDMSNQTSAAHSASGSRY